MVLAFVSLIGCCGGVSSCADVPLEEIFVFEFGGLAGEDEFAAVEHEDQVGELECPGDVLLDDEQARSPVRKVAEEVEDLVDNDGCEAQGDFVEEEEPGGFDVGAGECEHLLFAATHGAGHLVESAAEDGEGLNRSVDGLRFANSEGLEPEVLADGKAAEDAASFGDVPDAGSGPPIGSPPGDVPVVEEDPADVGGEDPACGAHESGFPSTVGPEQGDDVRLWDGQVDVPENHGVAVAGADAFELEHLGGLGS